VVAIQAAMAGPRRVNWEAFGLAGVLAAIALLGTLPFLWTVHYLPIPSFGSELAAALCLGLALLCSAGLSGSATPLRWPLPSLLLGLAALAILQRELGMLAYSQQLVRFLLFAACMLLAYALGRRLAAAGRTAQAIECFCWALIAGGVYTVFVQWLQVFDIEVLPKSIAVVVSDLEARVRPFGNLSQANHATSYLAIAAFAAFTLAVRARRAWLLAPALAIFASGIAMTGSRMGTVFLLLILAVLFAPTGLRPDGARLRWGGALAGLLGYAAGLVAVRHSVGEFDTITRFAQNTWPIRQELWWQAWHIGLQHPLIGFGVGQFPAGLYWLAREGDFAFMAGNCHNLVLQVAAEFGWPAALAVCALGVNWVGRDFPQRCRRPETAFAMAALLVISIHSMLEFPLWYLYFAIPAAFLFALGEPEQGAGALDLRLLLPLSGLAVLGVGVAMNLEYGWVAEAYAPVWLEMHHVRARQPGDALALMIIADTKMFQPEIERLMLDLNHPPDEHSDAPLERASRVLRAFAAPEVAAHYIVLLARAGRIDEAVRHARRMYILAHAGYPDLRDGILDQTRSLGPETAPLRHALREMN